MLHLIQSQLSVKIALKLSAIAVALSAGASWLVVTSNEDSVKEAILERARVAAIAGAAAYASTLETGISTGAITMADLIEPKYQKIEFPDIKPPLVVEDLRYHTKYDWYTDTHGIQQIQDAILESSPSFVFASGIDLRGYVPTPHKKHDEPPTGDPEHDRKSSRAKRKYDKPEQLAAAGYMGNEPTLVQDYHRDTGEPIWDVAAPIYVRDGHGGREHFGAFRVGVSKDQIGIAARDLALELVKVLGVAVLLLVAAIFLSIRRSLRPLHELAVTATLLSTSGTGAELRRPIKMHQPDNARADEIGRLTRALNRMRLSCLAAFERT